MKLKFLFSVAVSAVLTAGAGVAHADEFPERPINLIAPFNAGGGTDLLLRG